MPRFILDSCIACGSCQAECPVDCISEGDIYVIDEEACIDCGACQEVCPVEAIIER
ncbi:MAG TPA: 4Fe-4S binding protein [Acholeplasmataceae bacterium]|jgi:NAD-dependent dihydropyrimidine dehydrogenase PreA subunit|nr:4Fe-4S binding protein [Acholeplasmataceae bacterium]